MITIFLFVFIINIRLPSDHETNKFDLHKLSSHQCLFNLDGTSTTTTYKLQNVITDMK